jgi:hypothetical protein
VILTETSLAWVGLKGDGITPLRDGGFLWTTERSGFRHIEHHAADGALIRSVTAGDWPIDTVTTSTNLAASCSSSPPWRPRWSATSTAPAGARPAPSA